MATSLTSEILEQSHTARDYLEWVRDLINAVKTEPEGLQDVRLGIGLAKELIQEAFPIGLFASTYFARSPEVEIAMKVGSQTYDATVRDSRAKPSGIEYLEVTVASEGEIDYLRMLTLHQTGAVSGLGQVTKVGTRKTALRIHVEPEAVSQQTVLDRERLMIAAAIERKVGKPYPRSTALIIAFDDIMSYDRQDNQANILAVLSEYRGGLQGFHSVAVVGLIQGLFLLQERSAA